MRSFEVEVGSGDGSCADGELYDGLRLELCFVILRKRVDGNPKCVEKLLFSN